MEEIASMTRKNAERFQRGRQCGKGDGGEHGEKPRVAEKYERLHEEDIRGRREDGQNRQDDR